MVQNRKRLRRLYADTFVAARMSKDPDATEVLVCPEIFSPQRISSAEAIDERRQSTFTVCMGKKMKCLKTLGRILLGAMVSK
jgi:hypothetical protein